MTIDDQIGVIGAELHEAADQIIVSATRGLDLTAKVAGDDLAGALRDVFNRIMATCAFEDLSGQRLARLAAAIAGRPASGDPLLNGPARPGAGLDQAAADAAFDLAGPGDV